MNHNYRPYCVTTTQHYCITNATPYYVGSQAPDRVCDLPQLLGREAEEHEDPRESTTAYAYHAQYQGMHR